MKPIDWRALEAEGRVAERVEGLAVMEGRDTFSWGDGVAELAVVRARVGLVDTGDRLTARLEGASGNATPFLVDTGSQATLLSASAPLAREARVARKHTFEVLQGKRETGHFGHLPVVRLGALSGRDLTVGVVERAHTEQDPQNVLGVVHLWGTQLEHAAERWTLRSGASRKQRAERGWRVVRLEPGLPIVKVRAPDGRDVHALIDTGAPWSLAVEGFGEGDYAVRAPDGSTALALPVRDTVRWKGLNAGGYTIAVLIGMRELRSRDWILTLSSSTWAFPP